MPLEVPRKKEFNDNNPGCPWKYLRRRNSKMIIQDALEALGSTTKTIRLNNPSLVQALNFENDTGVD
jgi:hypothetical protein